jgi:hypothetical protein
VLPRLAGKPIRVEIVESLGPHWAATHIPKRVIRLDSGVLQREFERILIHEIFHFVWVRLGNPSRREWGELVAQEKSKGELGWSAEHRKARLKRIDRREGSRRWRDYVCESFCDTAAWMYSGGRHSEHTLGVVERNARRRWFTGRFTEGVRI